MNIHQNSFSVQSSGHLRAFDGLLLIAPPQPLLVEGFRTGLIALAGYISRKLPGFKIRIVDLSTVRRLHVREVLEKAIRFSGPNALAGISTVTADYQAALFVAREIKKLAPGMTVILGGHHASGDAETILKHQPIIDYVIYNEGEVPLHQLLTSFPNVTEVPGLVYRSGPDIVKNSSPALLDKTELDLIPLTYEGWELSNSPGKLGHVTYVSARGCPLQCAFCAVGSRQIRYKSIPQICNDISRLVAMGHSRIAFEDNFFAHNRLRTRAICEALIELRAHGINFSWDCQTRVESLDNPEAISLMERAGCEAVFLGVESFNADVLTFLEKTRDPRGYVSRLNDRVVPQLLNSSISCYFNLVFGIPGETGLQIEENIASMAHLGTQAAQKGKKITIFPQLFVVYPGTAHFRHYRELLVLPANAFESFTLWESEQKPILKWLGETFAHGTGGIPLGLLDQTELWEGKYKIRKEIVRQISETIMRLGSLPGVEVFQYGQSLIPEASCLIEEEVYG